MGVIPIVGSYLEIDLLENFQDQLGEKFLLVNPLTTDQPHGDGGFACVPIWSDLDHAETRKRGTESRS